MSDTPDQPFEERIRGMPIRNDENRTPGKPRRAKTALLVLAAAALTAAATWYATDRGLTIGGFSTSAETTTITEPRTISAALAELDADLRATRSAYGVTVNAISDACATFRCGPQARERLDGHQDRLDDLYTERTSDVEAAAIVFGNAYEDDNQALVGVINDTAGLAGKITTRLTAITKFVNNAVEDMIGKTTAPNERRAMREFLTGYIDEITEEDILTFEQNINYEFSVLNKAMRGG